MAGTSSKIKFNNDNSCVVCSKTVFHFEGRVRVVDLDQQEKAACSLMDSADQTRLQTDNEAVVCVSCYCKVQQDGDGSTGVEDNTREDETDGTLKGKSSPTQTSLRSSRHTSTSTPFLRSSRQNSTSTPSLRSSRHTSTTALRSSRHISSTALRSSGQNSTSTTSCSSEKVTERGSAKKVKPAVPEKGGREGSITGEPVSTADSGKFHSMNNPTRLLAFALLASAVFGSVVTVMRFGMVGVLVVCLILLMIIAIKDRKFQQWIHLIFEPGTLERQGKVNASAKPRLSMDTTQAATLTIISGNSLAGTSTLALLQDGYRVTCGIEVENWTCFTLTHPHVHISGGTLTLAPSNIASATREVMVARKPSGLAEGTYGTVSWLLQTMNRRLVVMWSAPFNFNHYSNWLAVGLTAVGVTEHPSGNVWFKQMYYKNSTDQLKFERGEYYSDIRPVLCRDDDFEVEGIMSSDHKAVVKIILRPLDHDFFASSMKEKMNVI